MSSQSRKRLEGTTIHGWTVGDYIGHGDYYCKCVCGKMRVVQARSLYSGDSKSCGCLAKALREESKKKILEKQMPYKGKEKYE